MAVLISSRAGDSHWYTQSGAPLHRLSTSNGATRPTTLRDARDLLLLPSVTNVLGLLAKPGLEIWKQKQVALASIRVQRGQGEPEEAFVERILAESSEPVDRAAALGVRIHKCLDSYWRGGTVPADVEAYVSPTLAKLGGIVQEVLASEHVLVNTKHGFAGTADLLIATRRGNRAVIDFKCRKTRNGAKVEWYSEHLLQVAAYAATAFGEDDLARTHGANVLISSTEPGRVEINHFTPEDLVEGFKTFSLICEVWRRLKGYDPRVV